jgi:1-acyl-sn-glycerol-3-phosphate acyltransferase
LGLIPHLIDNVNNASRNFEPKVVLISRLYQFWCLLVVFISLLIVTPLYLLIFSTQQHNRIQKAHSVSKIWAKFLLTCFFIPVKVIGKELIDPNQTYVFVSNHQSQLDIPLVALATGNVFQFLAKEELIKIPLLGYIIKNLYITVDRSSARARVKSYQKMKEAIANNISVWIFPEGTRHTDPHSILPFQEGAFRLAKDTKHPVAVLTIKGSNRILSPSIKGMKWGRVTLEWSTPFYGDSEKVMMEMAQEEILKKLGE